MTSAARLSCLKHGRWIKIVHASGKTEVRPCPMCNASSRDKMAVAMNREPDPATDEGYGPRAVND